MKQIDRRAKLKVVQLLAPHLCGKDSATASSSIRVALGEGAEMAATTGMMRR